jgi:hypothetical protein
MQPEEDAASGKLQLAQVKPPHCTAMPTESAQWAWTHTSQEEQRCIQPS